MAEEFRAVLYFVDAAAIKSDCANPYFERDLMVTEFRSTHQELHTDIESMCQWLESLTIGIEQNRVAEYRKTFATIAEHIQNGTVSELENSIGFPKQADNFHDASELILISQQLSEYNSPIFKSTLAKAVNGPISLEAERAKSSDARNRIFELVMAAQFRAAGIPLKFVEPSDAIITVDNVKCFVECKRIQTEKALEERVRQASSQIEKRLNQEASAKPRGLIAIDISKTVNTDGTLYFSAPSADYLARWVDDRIEAFLSRNRTRLTSRLDPRVCAVLLYLRTPAVIEDEERLANFRRLFTVRTPDNEKLNQRVYAKLVDQLWHVAAQHIFK
jgi:hypothetical protein